MLLVFNDAFNNYFTSCLLAPVIESVEAQPPAGIIVNLESETVTGLYHCKVETAGKPPETLYFDAPSASITIDGLETSKTYNISIRLCEAICSVYSAIVTVNTPQAGIS